MARVADDRGRLDRVDIVLAGELRRAELARNAPTKSVQLQWRRAQKHRLDLRAGRKYPSRAKLRPFISEAATACVHLYAAKLPRTRG